MLSTLTIRDETAFAFDDNPYVFALDFPSAQVTVRELIRTRVEREVAEYNASQPEIFRGLVQPTDAERMLNGFRLPKRRQLDPEEQCALAIEAFARNGYLVLVNDRQVDDLDEMIEIEPGTSVTFLKLVPLAGG